MEVEKKSYTEEERMKLAEKLDKDLDDFINSLEKKRYTDDGWSEDTWQQEIEKHPFFMKKAPELGEELNNSPLLEGLQQLKFDPEENTPEELAEKYKEDGNYYMKHKKYRIAIMNYTEGLQQKKHDNNLLIASLYNNRSAAQYFLKNFRSAILDAQEALKYKSDYCKAKIRILRCNMDLRKYDEVCNDVEKYLADDPTNSELINIQKQAIIKRAEKLRDDRKNQMQEKKKRQEFQALIQALIQRNVKFEEVGCKELSSLLSINIIKPKIEPLENTPVIYKDGIVFWPIVFCYPEFSITDIQQQVHEMVTIWECLQDMFEAQEYSLHNYKNPDDLNVYFENRHKGQIIKADFRKSIKDIVSNENFWVYNGYLTFYVIPKGSKIECDFLNQKRNARE